MRTRLTDRSINRKPPEKGQLELWDTVLPGFGLRISYGGKRSYFVMTRIHGKQRRLAVGNATLIGLADAREKARGIMQDAERGISPLGKAQAEAREAKIALQGTFVAVANQYMREKGLKRKSADELRRKLDRDILPALGQMQITEITRTDVKDLLFKKAETAPVAANRLLALIRPIFNYAMDEELLDRVPNFRNLTQEETPRDRVLSDEELRYIWRGCLRLGYPYGHLVRFLILTGQRRGEVAGLTRSELRDESWQLPSERSKNGVGHLIPISGLAQSILEDCPKTNGDGLVFAGVRHVDREGVLRAEACEISGWSKFKKRLDKAIAEIRQEEMEGSTHKLGSSLSIASWTLHDLRRTAATGMQSLGFSDEIVDRILNHVLPGVRKTYNRFSRDPEKRRVLDAWAVHVQCIIDDEKKPSNVVSIQGSAT